MSYFLHIDCEMGGRDLNYSLLTAYFMITDSQFNFIADLSLAVKPDDGNYMLSGQGMSVNKINIQSHDQVAIPYKTAKTVLYQFLQTHGKTERLVPVGHGVVGDIDHILKYLITEGSWHQFCTYHYIDTSVVLQFLRACGKMPMDQDGSVEALAKYFKLNIGNIGKLHDAKTDTILTSNILKAMIELNNQMFGPMG